MTRKANKNNSIGFDYNSFLSIVKDKKLKYVMNILNDPNYMNKNFNKTGYTNCVDTLSRNKLEERLLDGCRYDKETIKLIVDNLLKIGFLTVSIDNSIDRGKLQKYGSKSFVMLGYRDLDIRVKYWIFKSESKYKALRKFVLFCEDLDVQEEIINPFVNDTLNPFLTGLSVIQGTKAKGISFEMDINPQYPRSNQLIKDIFSLFPQGWSGDKNKGQKLILDFKKFLYKLELEYTS
ncbi:MAG: hypothetical protein ACQESG_02060 [Nanobdellota archaeon]